VVDAVVRRRRVPPILYVVATCKNRWSNGGLADTIAHHYHCHTHHDEEISYYRLCLIITFTGSYHKAFKVWKAWWWWWWY